MKMKYKEAKELTGFKEHLRDQDIYTTPDSARRKGVISPTLYFYLQLIGIIKTANRLAREKIYNHYRWVNSSFNVIRALEKSGVRFQVEGIQNIKKTDGPVIFIGNHMSTLETMALPGIIQPIKPVIFIIKRELADFPLFGAVAAARHPIMVGRDNPREDLIQAMKEGKEKLAEGRSIIVFPQRTRCSYVPIGTFNTLGIKIAKQNNVPVIPIALYTEAWGNGKILKDFGKIDPSKQALISIGEPIYIKGSGKEEHQQVINYIKKKYFSWDKGEYIRD